LYQAFDPQTKQCYYYKADGTGNFKELMGGNYTYGIRAYGYKDIDVCLWTRENFNEEPNLWISNKFFENPQKVTTFNPNMNNLKWGSVELIEWTDFNGKKSTGLLYKPENYDSNRKYPTIVYFYEKSTDDMFRFHKPQPSWSIIIPSVCTSNDYVVFIPDIDYEIGYPGKSCYNKIVSGAQALIERGIADPDRIGLQGQSWGGYQIAYLVTRTNMFRCASPGAPVSSMVSAYTGIRTTTGMVRMFMYEHGQSRIGASLWEAPMRYVENSPIFFAPRVETPLLIRHDDADEAVPYQQGVDLFMALKRCGKKVWLLNYNKEPHNLRSRAARMDWDLRMMQFFDYYLKDAKMPRWMKEGISVKEKNKDRKYDLVD
jgi:dipeptidyl aminopeptidase/acylaminoacyl peptidase